MCKYTILVMPNLRETVVVTLACDLDTQGTFAHHICKGHLQLLFFLVRKIFSDQHPSPMYKNPVENRSKILSR